MKTISLSQIDWLLARTMNGPWRFAAGELLPPVGLTFGFGVVAFYVEHGFWLGVVWFLFGVLVIRSFFWVNTADRLGFFGGTVYMYVEDGAASAVIDELPSVLGTVVKVTFPGIYGSGVPTVERMFSGALKVRLNTDGEYIIEDLDDTTLHYTRSTNVMLSSLAAGHFVLLDDLS